MSFFKYFRESQDSDGEKLWWPGGPDGYPYRGKAPPTVTDSEFSEMKPTGKFKQRLFHLAKEDEAQEYTIIRDKCSNGYYIPIDRDRVWDEGSNNYRIYLEWVEPAYEAPPAQSGGKDAIKEHIATDSITVPYSRLAGVRDNENW